MKLLLFTLLGIAALVNCCDIDVYVQSDTARTFSVQIVAPNGQRSERWTFNRNRQRQMFGQDVGVCTVGDWVLETYGDNGVLAKSVRVHLDGSGRVVYSVNDALELTQIEKNNGIICNGQCVASASGSASGSRSFSRTGSRNNFK